MSEREEHIVNQPVTEETKGNIPHDQEVTQVIPSERHRIPKRLGMARRFALSGLAAVTWLTGGSVINSGPIRPSDESLILDNYAALVTEPILGPTLIPQSTPQPTSITGSIGDRRSAIGLTIPTPDNTPDAEAAENEASNLIAEIKRKYNVELITQADARVSENGNPSESEWTLPQLMLMDELLSYVPKHLLDLGIGVNTKIFTGSFSTICECKGVMYGDSGTIGLNENLFENPRHKGKVYFVLIHELIHKNDFLTKDAIHPKLKEIIGEPSILQGKLIKSPALTALQEDTALAHRAFDSLTDESEHFVEGVAEMGRLYVRGYERFMNAVGPILDGEKEDLEISSLKEAYPKTQEFYNAFKYTLFGGEDSSIYEATKLLIDPNMDIQEAKEKVEAKIPVDIISGTDNNEGWNNTIQIQSLGIALENLPKQFYIPRINEETHKEIKLKIALGDSTKLVSQDELVVNKNWIDEEEILPSIAAALARRIGSYDSFKQQILQMYGQNLSETDLDNLANASISNYVFSAGDLSPWFMMQTSYFLNHLNQQGPKGMTSEVLYDYIGQTIFENSHFEPMIDIGGNVTLSIQPN